MVSKTEFAFWVTFIASLFMGVAFIGLEEAGLTRASFYAGLYAAILTALYVGTFLKMLYDDYDGSPWDFYERLGAAVLSRF